MEGGYSKEEPESLKPGIFEIPGEPAVLINGVPDVLPPSQKILANSNNAPETEQPRDTGFGLWLEGREVKKQFGDQYYTGTVTEYDKESGWYRVVYEDGDSEDLEWHELRDVLEPLDVSIPLKNLALKIIRKNEKTDFPNVVSAVSSGASAYKTKSRKNEKLDLPIVVRDVSSSASANKTKSGKPIRRPKKTRLPFQSVTVVLALRPKKTKSDDG